MIIVIALLAIMIFIILYKQGPYIEKMTTQQAINNLGPPFGESEEINSTSNISVIGNLNIGGKIEMVSPNGSPLTTLYGNPTTALQNTDKNPPSRYIFTSGLGTSILYFDNTGQLAWKDNSLPILEEIYPTNFYSDVPYGNRCDYGGPTIPNCPGRGCP